MKLTDRLDKDILVYKGIKIELCIYFDVVLRCFELLKDDAFENWEKLSIATEMFTKNKEDIATLNTEEKVIIGDKILKKFIFDGQKDKQQNNEKPIYDIDKDASYIYASFMYDYGIDLFEMQGKMHWKKFKALLGALSEKSKFGRVLGYRTAKIPAANKYNAEERKRLLELKRIYSLQYTTTVEEIDKKFDALASMLRPRG